MHEEPNAVATASLQAGLEAVLGEWPSTPEEKAEVEKLREELRDYGNEKLAAKLGLSRTAVSNWAGYVPAPRVRVVSEITGIPMRRLRPDLYDANFRKPAEPAGAPATAE